MGEKQITWRTVAIGGFLSVVLWLFLTHWALPTLGGQLVPIFDTGTFIRDLIVQPILFIIWVWLALKAEKMKLI